MFFKNEPLSFDEVMACVPDMTTAIHNQLLEQITGTIGNREIWGADFPVDDDSSDRAAHALKDLFYLSLLAWEEEKPDYHEFSSFDLAEKHALLVSSERGGFIRALLWLAHQPENDGAAFGFVHFMLGVLELCYINHMKHINIKEDK